MIRELRVALGPEHQREYTSFLVWATLYGVFQGLAVSFLLPIARALSVADYNLAWRWIGALLVAAIFSCIAQYVQAMKGFRVAMVVLKTMHLSIGDHLVKLPLGWFAGKVGSVSQVATKGTIAVGSAAAHLMTPLVVGIAGPTTVAIMMLFFDWRIGVALIISAPLIILSSRLASKMISRGEKITHAASVEANDRVIEFARCQPVLRAFGRTGSAGYAPLNQAIQAQQVATRRSLGDSVGGLLISGVTLQLVFTAIVALAAALALGGSLSGIDVLALLGIASRFIQPLSEVGEFSGAIRMARGELARIGDIFAAEPLPEPKQSAAITTAGAIDLENVTFGYDANTKVLNDISITVPPHTMTALVGPSGSGKTTVTRLIARFYDVNQGTVRVGGTDVREQSSEDLMAQLALVFQDVYLFDDTLRANIQVGDPDATAEQVDEAAYLAGVMEIVDRLPDGWETRVGEGGSALSGGERQRVSIARALLKRAPIVLLDEATAALDPENERFVQRSLEKLRQSSTLIVIAHKLSTVTLADEIVVLDESGTVAERGTHAELLDLGGRYADFWAERSAVAGWSLLPTAN